jgi:hypothetical protein
LQILYYKFVLRTGKCTTFGPNVQNLQISKGYIFRILQHFAAKLCNFTNFNMLFPAISGDGFCSSCLDQNLVSL